jgi:hypothetical protein
LGYQQRHCVHTQIRPAKPANLDGSFCPAPMNYDLEKFNELRQIRKELSSIAWMIFVSLFFIVPACIVIVWIGSEMLYANHELAKLLK